MNDESFFPARPETRPMIYAYEEDNPKSAGMLKVGLASTGVEKRVAELEGKHEGEGVGLFNTVLTAEEYITLHRLQQASL